MDTEPVDGGVYKWTYSSHRTEEMVILIKQVNGNWYFYGIRPDRIHHWSGGAENLSLDDVSRALSNGTFGYVCKLGDIFYGRS